MLRRPRSSSQHPTRGSHSDDEEDEGVPASYHTVSLQVSQDVSMAPFASSPLPAPNIGSLGGARDSQDRVRAYVFQPRPSAITASVLLSKTTYKSLVA